MTDETHGKLDLSVLASMVPPQYPVVVKYEKIHPDAKLPTKGTPLRAYYDVYSVEDVELTPEKVFMVHTGLKVQPQKGWFIDIRPRSGLAKEGITINNSPGTLDCDYGGELIVELIWHLPAHETIHDPLISNYRTGEEINYYKYMMHRIITGYKIKKGDRIAQISVMPMYEIEWKEDKIEGTEGFGSTGK